MPRHYNNRGLTLHELKRFEEALASYDRALKVRPDYAEALLQSRFTLHELKRFEEALASYDRALTVRPDYAEALSNRGNTLHELKRFEEALASYDRALKVRPDFAEAHNNLGLALMQLGHLSEARAALERAVELAPDKAKYRRDLGEITRFAAGDAHLAALEKLAEDSATLSVGDRIELHFALAKAYEDLGRHAEAFTQWLDGNALKRRQITYNEAATLGGLDRVQAVFTSELIRSAAKCRSSVPGSGVHRRDGAIGLNTGRADSCQPPTGLWWRRAEIFRCSHGRNPNEVWAVRRLFRSWCRV